MWVHRIWAQASYETIAVLRNGEQLLLAVILPVIILVGVAFTDILSAVGGERAGHSDLQVITAGVFGLCVASSAFTGQAIATAFDRRYGVLRHLATTPLGVSGLVWGKLVAVMVVIAVQFVIITACALSLGVESLGGATGVLGIVIFAVAGAICFLAFAMLLAGTIRAEATLALANLLWVLLASVGGLVISRPGMWATAMGWLPGGALGDGFRSAVLDGRLDLPALAVLVIWGIVGIMFARRFFSFT